MLLPLLAATPAMAADAPLTASYEAPFECSINAPPIARGRDVQASPFQLGRYEGFTAGDYTQSGTTTWILSPTVVTLPENQTGGAGSVVVLFDGNDGPSSVSSTRRNYVLEGAKSGRVTIRTTLFGPDGGLLAGTATVRSTLTCIAGGV